MFFFQAEDGIRDIGVTGVQTCALPIYLRETDKTILLISHDRAFLAAVVDHVLHVEGGTAAAYTGGDESFIVQREERRLTQQRTLDKQEAKGAGGSGYTARKIAGQNSKPGEGGGKRRS